MDIGPGQSSQLFSHLKCSFSRFDTPDICEVAKLYCVSSLMLRTDVTYRDKSENSLNSYDLIRSEMLKCKS